MLLKIIRKASIDPTLILLEEMMPESGGFLEAIPLTAFVSLCLINSGYKNSPVVRKGIDFLQKTQRPDGSWPIDIDLSTWVTSLAVKSLGNKLPEVLNADQRERLIEHYLAVQNKGVHPFNGTSAGGWGWTNYSGSVPDGDDTPGSILALLSLLGDDVFRYQNEILNGCSWLLSLQNTDGGFPTFARGWGKLPFDQSCADLTGHALLALSKVLECFAADLKPQQIVQYRKALSNAITYLQRHQQDNGALLPLWFGNQLTSDHTNPVYGTARVVSYLSDSLQCEWMEEHLKERIRTVVVKGIDFLIYVQNQDGSWGGDKNVAGSIEETALALSALSCTDKKEAITKGFYWLDRTFKKQGLKASPIGLYFASLWYSERMYPLTAYLEAISRQLVN